MPSQVLSNLWRHLLDLHAFGECIAARDPDHLMLAVAAKI